MSAKKSRFFQWRYYILSAVLIATAGLVSWGLFVPQPVQAAGPLVTVYRSPSCGCCGKWVEQMRDNGFEVAVKNMDNMNSIKQRFGIPMALRSCHTATVGDYVIEGHVPPSSIQRLLAEQIPTRGLAVPGMVMGSPGMEGGHPVDYNVMQFNKDGKTSVFETKKGKSTRD